MANVTDSANHFKNFLPPAFCGAPNQRWSGDLRRIFAAQCRLLASRAETGFRIDRRSVLNLLRCYVYLWRSGGDE
jgi:hypothetical protein